MKSFQFFGDWVDLGHDHSARLLKHQGQVVGLALTHLHKSTGEPCETALVQWEPTGDYRPLFTLDDAEKAATVTPHAVCDKCGDAGYITRGEWVPREAGMF